MPGSESPSSFRGFHGSLGIIFVGPVYDLETLLKELRDRQGAVRVAYVRTSAGRLKVVDDPNGGDRS
jgi:hypothetical protein